MKSLVKILCSITLFCVVFFACEEKDDDLQQTQGKGEVAFSFDLNSVIDGGGTTNGRTAASVPDKIVVTIASVDDGSTVYNKEALDVITFNGNYISDPIYLQVGGYQLTEYFVLDANGSVLYLTPIDGSALAYLVTDALTIEFDIAKDDSKQIAPEVISPDGYDAPDFGYTDFSFDIVTTIDFLMSVHYFDTISVSYELTDASVLVYGDDTEVYESTISDSTTQIRVRDEFADYTIVTSKSGFVSDTVTLSNSELEAYIYKPLMVILSPVVVDTFSVPATEAAYVEGGGVVVGSFMPGESFSLSVEDNDTWSYGTPPGFTTNANGNPDDMITLGSFTFPVNSLVGSLDEGETYFLVGTDFTGTVATTASAQLRLYNWDNGNYNNVGSVSVTLTRL